MKIILTIYILTSLLFSSGIVLGQNRLEGMLKLDKDGIKVFVYEKTDSDISAFRAVTYIKSTLDSILAVMFDNKSCTEWIHACDESIVLEDVSFNERYHYQICDIPFPFKDRDFIFHSIMRQNPVTKAVDITISSEPNYCNDKQSEECLKVKQSDLVRVSKSLGVYRLEPDGEGTKVTWIQHTDPSGQLPSWIVNQFIKDTPYLTLKKLADKVKEDKYHYAKLVYDLDGIAIALNSPTQQQINTLKTRENLVIYPSF
ncbi:MAG: hypothetical protein KZQ83_06575 [gamma proteobacterium symbiont of Taylorina sp.]|nr:hypothetical protein [gamma proteobacterium symbiont of Taylorina sp.]